jgi:DNA (cytosine-5)-methyltransferase 1
VLDAYSGQGGAGMGYHRAGFEVVGVDKAPQPRYPFEFHRGDALAFIRDHGHEFEVIHASPPCKSENPLRHLSDADHPDLLTPTLELLAGVDRPWVVENVAATSKLPGALVLCGTEFGLHSGGRWLRRHRRFGSNRWLMGAGGCTCGDKSIGGVYGTGGGGQMTRGYKFGPAEAREAMGIDWMSRAGLSQAIPPAYTHWIGEQLLAHMSERAA